MDWRAEAICWPPIAALAFSSARPGGPLPRGLCRSGTVTAMALVLRRPSRIFSLKAMRGRARVSGGCPSRWAPVPWRRWFAAVSGLLADFRITKLVFHPPRESGKCAWPAASADEQRLRHSRTGRFSTICAVEVDFGGFGRRQYRSHSVREPVFDGSLPSAEGVGVGVKPNQSYPFATPIFTRLHRQIVACEPDTAKGARRKPDFSLALFGKIDTFRRNALTWCAGELFSSAVCLASINKVKTKTHIAGGTVDESE